MNIITVIPFSRSKLTDELSYFTAGEVPVGAIVTVPLRAKKVQAIVITCRKAVEIKSEIKSAPFHIRKLTEIKSLNFFPEAFMNAVSTIALQAASTTGPVISALVSDLILENIQKIQPPLPLQNSLVSDRKSGRVLAVQGDEGDRLSTWRSLIRQEFATKKSLAIYVPTIEDCERYYEALEKGIEGYIFILNGNLSEKNVLATWQKIAETSHPVVVIATGSFSLLPRDDIETMIIEKENSSGWISRRIPYLDARKALETVGRENGRTIYLADSLLSTETLEGIEKGSIDQGMPFKWRSVSTARDRLVDMQRKDPRREIQKKELPTEGTSREPNTDDPSTKKEPSSQAQGSDKSNQVSDPKPRFRILSDELKGLIRTNYEENTHLFILATRRGVAPTTVCDYCETLVTCNHCSAPVVLHTSNISGKNFFMCHSCGDRRSAFETCRNCGSFHLTPLGIGIDRIAEAIKENFPSIDLFQIDSDTTKTDKSIREILDQFRTKPGSILLGTELAMNRFSEPVDYSAVVSLDSLFALPDFRIQEKIMYTLVRLRARTIREILVQTRRPEEKVFEWGLKGNLSDFARANRDERKLFGYPPFSTLVKITIEGKREQISETMSEVKTILAPHEIDVFPAFTATLRGRSVIHGLVKIPAGSWPDKELVAKILSLPQSVTVKINPESLL